MMDNFNSLRFKNDNPENYGFSSKETCEDSFYQKDERARLLADSVRVVPELFPKLYEELEPILHRFKDRYVFEIYVYQDNNLQAKCMKFNEGFDALILISSAMIKLLSSKELCFVIGHEIGHLVFDHFQYPEPDDSMSDIQKFNIMELKRAAEISADRIGHVCSKSIDSSLKAMLKTISGLPDEYMRFDIGVYLQQLKDIKETSTSESFLHSSHPMFPLRVRALLLFEKSKAFNDFFNTGKSDNIGNNKLDSMIQNDMDAVSGFSMNLLREEKMNSAEMWSIIYMSLSDNVLSKVESRFMENKFGKEKTEKIKEYIKDNGRESIISKFEKSLQEIKNHPKEMKEEFINNLHIFINTISRTDEKMQNVFDRIKSRLL